MIKLSAYPKAIGPICILTALCCLGLCFPSTGIASDEHDRENEPSAASPAQSPVDPAHEGHDDHEDIVRLSPDEMAEFGVELAVAGPGRLRRHLAVPGEIVVNDDRLAHIFPRFPGIVKAVHKTIGDEVMAGDVLAVIESNESLTPFEMKSLIAGTVIDKHITLGEVSSEERPAFVIADLDTVWVNLSIYQEDLPRVASGQEVALTAGQGVPKAHGTISYISPVVDEHTRTATARVVMPNHNGACRPGLFVTGEITIDESDVAIMVPPEAIQTFENQEVVFIQEEDGFVPAPVVIGRTNNAAAEIVSGLAPGTTYVHKGGFIIKAEMLKSAFDDGHNH